MSAPELLASPRSIGDHLRDWRRRRRLSQLHFALDADISQKHLSFIESGRARPSREMVLRLAERLDVPLRERNRMLTAAGYAPAYRQRNLDDPELAPARAAVELLLKGHEPFPAIAIDSGWSVLAANAGAAALMGLARDPALLAPPVNALRLSLAPGGLAPMIENLAEWRAHLIERVKRQIEASSDATLTALLAEIQAYGDGGAAGPARRDYGGVLVPLRIRTPSGVLAFFSTTTVFGTPLEITLAEIAVESFFPADAATAKALARRDEPPGA